MNTNGEHFRDSMSNMAKGVAHTEHAGLPLKDWNMIQMMLMQEFGEDAWFPNGSIEFKSLMDEEPELVEGFVDMSKEEQDEAIGLIKEKMETRLDLETASH